MTTTHFHNLPPEMKEWPQWVCWSLVERDGKKTKLPINPHTGALARTDDPSTWATFDEAVAASAKFNGIGFVFSAGDPFFGIDTDLQIDHSLIRYFNTYAERSQSGRGCHIIGVGKLAGAGRKSKEYEVYDRLRFFVCTGDAIHKGPIREAQAELDDFLQHAFPPPKGADLAAVLPSGWLADALSGTGYSPSDEAELFKRIRTSTHGPKFDTLWSGDVSRFSSHSEADASLLAILRFWTGGDQGASFALFLRSGLARGKTYRKDYLPRTWAKVDHGPVWSGTGGASPDFFIPGGTISEAAKPIKQEPRRELPPNLILATKAPWRMATIEHVGDVIGGTVLEPVVRALMAPMKPALPMEIALIKALVLCGGALTYKAEQPRNLGDYISRGVRLAKLRILTAGGQVCNFWGLICAPSATGKDVGNLMENATIHMRLLLGTAGSEEGIADAYIRTPNGILKISEMQNWLDKRHWQSKAASFLTGAFNAGWFSHAMSSRNKDAPAREADYCVPNIYASVQPGILQQFATRTDLDSGFLGRFLVAASPTDYWGHPVSSAFDHELKDIVVAMETLKAKEGEIGVEDNYAMPLMEQFATYRAEPVPSWKRLCGEYYPRLALLLSTRHGDTSPAATITAEGWKRAAVMVNYFFGQAEEVFGGLHFDPVVAAYEARLERIMTIIRTSSVPVTRTVIHNRCGRGTTHKQRDEALMELVTRGTIIQKLGEAPDGGGKAPIVYAMPDAGMEDAT